MDTLSDLGYHKCMLIIHSDWYSLSEFNCAQLPMVVPYLPLKMDRHAWASRAVPDYTSSLISLKCLPFSFELAFVFNNLQESQKNVFKFCNKYGFWKEESFSSKKHIKLMKIADSVLLILFILSWLFYLNSLVRFISYIGGVWLGFIITMFCSNVWIQTM